MDASLLSAMTPQQLAATPAGYPPPGVIPNLVNPPSDGYIFYIVSAIVLVFMFTFAGIRYYTKLCVWHKTTLDDWTTLIAIIGTCIYYVIGVLTINKGRYGTHIWDLSIAQIMSDQMIITGYFVNWFANIPRAFGKTSFLLMYLELFRPFIWLRRAVYFGLFLNWGFYTSIMIVQLYFTSPAPGQTWQESFLSTRYLHSLNTAIPVTTVGLVIDVYILIVPLLAVKKLQLTRRKKIGLALVFATGLIAVIAAACSVYYSYRLHQNTADFTYAVLPVIVMVFVELGVGIACSCMPASAHLFKKSKLKWVGDDSSIRQLFSKIRSATSSTQSRATDPEKSQSSWISNRKVQDTGSESDSSEGQLWQGKGSGVRTTIHASTCSPDIEQGRIYVNREFHQVSRESR